MGRPTLLGHPSQKAGASPLTTVGVQAGVGAVDRHVAALDLAGGVGVAVRADNTPPAGSVALGCQVPGLGQPRQHVVGTVVVQRHPARGGGVGLGGRHAQRGADLLDGKLSLGVELGQDGGEAVAARFDVDRAGYSPVPHGVDGALVGVAGLGKGTLGGGGHGHRHLLT